MLTRRFGRTEIDMPVFSVGGMRYQHSWDASQKDRVPPENQRNLEAIVERALELGLNHFETARGYGTSEHQLGLALEAYPRERLIVQTKVPPHEDPRKFREHVEDSLDRLGLEYVDLFAFHGLNTEEHIDWTLRPGGCLEIGLELQASGRLRNLGFSTHAPTPAIIELCEFGKFSYVNLHYYTINRRNLPALHAAERADMGVFIISPTSVGGKLYQPPRKLVELCRPHSPLVFNDLFCLGHPQIKTLSLGAARPSDFDEHLEAVRILEQGEGKVDDIVKRLDEEYSRVLGEPYASRWSEGLPAWQDVPGEVNLHTVLWLGNLASAFDLEDYARERYKLLQTGGGHWFPGKSVDQLDFGQLDRVLADSPVADEIPARLRDYHDRLAHRLTLSERLQPHFKKIRNRLRRLKSRARALLTRS